MKIVFLALVFIFTAFNVFPNGIRDNMTPVEKQFSDNRNTITFIGTVRVFGNSPHTYVGIVDEEDVAYAVYPPAKEEELRALQGYSIEFTVVFVEERVYGSLFLRGGTVEPIRWEIIDEDN